MNKLKELTFKTPVGLFIHDWKNYSLKTAWYNQRFMFAYWLMQSKRMHSTPKNK